MTTHIDDRVRDKQGVVACIVDLPDGRLRLVFDDVESTHANSWTKAFFLTCNEYDRDEFQQSRLSDKQLADIGLAVVARLAALRAARARSGG